jgi:hypothetical protein
VGLCNLPLKASEVGKERQIQNYVVPSRAFRNPVAFSAGASSEQQTHKQTDTSMNLHYTYLTLATTVSLVRPTFPSQIPNLPVNLHILKLPVRLDRLHASGSIYHQVKLKSKWKGRNYRLEVCRAASRSCILKHTQYLHYLP